MLCHESHTVPPLYNSTDVRPYDKIVQLANCANEPRNELKDNILGANFSVLILGLKHIIIMFVSKRHGFYLRKQFSSKGHNLLRLPLNVKC